jgi:hypothetical protein
MAADLGELVAAVSSVAGNNPIVLVASPRQAAAIRVRTDVDFPIFSSAALADKTAAAIETNALFSVGDTAPRFDTSVGATLHMEDTTPLPISTPGSPATVAAPTRSLWQTDCVALKMQFVIDWALRNSAGVAYTTGVGW